MTVTSTPPAILGGPPAFPPPGPPACNLTPGWQALEAALQGIHDRQYYTEHGPLVRTLEERLSRLWAGQQAICVASDTVAHLMLFNALAPARLWLPAALPWALTGARPWLDPGMLASYDLGADLRAPEDLLDLLAPPPRADGPQLLVLACDEPPARRMRLHRAAAARGMPVVSHLACPAMMGADLVLPAAGHACVVSMRGTSLLQAGEGACIVTPDPDLADQLRTMRASSGVQRHLAVRKTVNGRMSEAQAAMALLSLDQLPARLERLAALPHPAGLAQLPGLAIVGSAPDAHLILEVVSAEALGLTRQDILASLAQENLHLPVPLRPVDIAPPPQANRRLAHCLEIPPCLRPSQAELMRLLATLRQHAPQIRQALKANAA